MSDERFRTLIVANPQSANGSLGRRWGELQQTIVERFGAFDHRFTRGPGDGAHVTHEALAQGYEMIVAMGGDGTVSEVVDGFFTPGGTAVRPDAVLGVLPFGTGGDFRKTINAPKELGAGAAALRGSNTERIDVGRLTYTTHDETERVLHFINIASFGIGGLVDELVNTSTKALGGAVSFALATVRAMLEYEPQRAADQPRRGAPRRGGDPEHRGGQRALLRRRDDGGAPRQSHRRAVRRGDPQAHGVDRSDPARAPPLQRAPTSAWPRSRPRGRTTWRLSPRTRPRRCCSTWMVRPRASSRPPSSCSPLPCGSRSRGRGRGCRWVEGIVEVTNEGLADQGRGLRRHGLPALFGLR